MVHADNQYDPGLVAEMAAPILAGEADIVIGSRLLDDRAIAGGMPRWKWVGNRLLTAIENRAFGVRFSEYHTGYRAFSAEFLRSIPFLRNSDDFVFDQEIFAQMLARGARVREIPIPTRYFHEASSRRLRHQPALRVQDPVGAGALPARSPLGAAPTSRRMDRARNADSGRDPARRAGDPDHLRPGHTELHARPRRDRLRPPRGVDRHRARVRAVATGARPRSGRPRTRSSSPASTRSSGPDKADGSSGRGSPTRSSGTGIVALIGLIAFQLWGRREALVALALGAVYIPLILVGQSVMSEPLFVLCLLGAIACVLHSALAVGARRGRADGARDPRPGERDHPARAAGVRGLARPWRAAGRAVRGRGADGRAVDDPQLRHVPRLRARSRRSSGPRWPARTTARRGRTRSTPRRGGR